MINTSQGSKSPEEALALFKRAKLPVGDLLGIFRQLEKYPEFKEAREHVLSNPGSYNEKLQRIAKEKSTGRPTGAKVINGESDLRQVLLACGLRARVAITIKKEGTHYLQILLSLNCLEIDDVQRSGLTAVALSGEWHYVPRTFTATLTLSSVEMLIRTERIFSMLVEKIELVSTLGERVSAYLKSTPLSEAVKTKLAENTELFYDRNLFQQACEGQNFQIREDGIDGLAENPTMEDVLMLFFANITREEFLDRYIEEFTTALA